MLGGFHESGEGSYAKTFAGLSNYAPGKHAAAFDLEDGRWVQRWPQGVMSGLWEG